MPQINVSRLSASKRSPARTQDYQKEERSRSCSAASDVSEPDLVMDQQVSVFGAKHGMRGRYRHAQENTDTEQAGDCANTLGESSTTSLPELVSEQETDPSGTTSSEPKLVTPNGQQATFAEVSSPSATSDLISDYVPNFPSLTIFHIRMHDGEIRSVAYEPMHDMIIDILPETADDHPGCQIIVGNEGSPDLVAAMNTLIKAPEPIVFDSTIVNICKEYLVSPQSFPNHPLLQEELDDITFAREKSTPPFFLYLLPEAQVEFFTTWDITLEEVDKSAFEKDFNYSFHDARRNLEDLLQSQAIDMALRWVLSVIKSLELENLPDLRHYPEREALWRSKITNSDLRVFLEPLAPAVDANEVLGDTSEFGGLEYITMSFLRRVDDIFLYQILQPTFRPFSLWIMNNFSRIMTGKGVCLQLGPPDVY
ncbi:hypothetical protein ONS96_004932 [Cadophora gregata f. sp. sojae]|nr:hypothetical protein ONS96_004932 [Cadophora gregata f. sp. sojae]